MHLVLHLKKLANINMRAATLVSKFALLFVMAKFLEPLDVGLYGLLAATVSLALMALGFDFYAYSTRELIATDRSQWAGMLRDQGVFYLITYAALLPLCLFLFSLGLLPWSLALWLFPLLALEHVAQELHRLLVAISQPLWASVVLFVRSGLWAVVVAFWLWQVPEHRSLNLVLAMWVAGVLLACGLGFSRLRDIDRASLQRAINWAWIRKGIRMSIPFVLATLSLRALYTVDRYWIESVGGVEQLAAYVLFVGIASAIINFLDAAVFSFAYPGLIASAGKGDRPAFNQQMGLLIQHTLWVTVALSVAALWLAAPVLGWLDKPSYTAHFNLLYWTVLAAALYGISMIPHYGLYARHDDSAIIWSHLASFPIFVGATILLLPQLAIMAVPAGMCVAFVFLLIAKTVAYSRCAPLILNN